MGKTGKYEGGSTLVTFRLPVKHLEEAKKGIEQYLERFLANKVPDSLIGRPLTPEDCLTKEGFFQGTFPEIELTEKERKIWFVHAEGIEMEESKSFVERLIPVEEKINRAELKAMQKKILEPDPEQYEIKRFIPEGFAIKHVTKPEAKIEKAYEKDNTVYYPCGCFRSIDSFHRFKDCKIGLINTHIDKYGI